MEHLGVELKMSTAFHPETDGQTERINQVLETYLRHYTNFQQDDWADLLPLAEHAYNTATAETTKVSPFFANYGYNPETQWVRPAIVDKANPTSEKLLKRWQNVWLYLEESILQAQSRTARYYDQHFQRQPHLNPGDLVMVNMKNMKTKRPSKKLDHKKLGPVEIIEAIGKRAYRVKLPPQARNHPVFHISELELYRQSLLEGRHQPPPPVEEIEGEANYVVETIGRSRENKRRNWVEYLVFWEGYPPEEATTGGSHMGTRREPVRNGRRGAAAVPSEISQATSRSEDLTFPFFQFMVLGFYMEFLIEFSLWMLMEFSSFS